MSLARKFNLIGNQKSSRRRKEQRQRLNRYLLFQTLQNRELLAADIGDAMEVDLASPQSLVADVQGSEFDLYRFDASAGSRLVAETAQPTGESSMDTYLRLFDDSGNVLAANDDGGIGFYSLIDHVFSADGTFLLGVSGYGNSIYSPVSGEGVRTGSSGDYHLAIELTTVDDGDHTSDPSAEFWDGQSPYSAIGSVEGSEFDLIQFQASAGSFLLAETSQPPGAESMDTYMRLFDANGVELARNDDGGTGYYSRLGIEIDAAGEYFLSVSGYGNSRFDPISGDDASPGDSGSYQLSIELSQHGAETVEPILVGAQQSFSTVGSLTGSLFDLYQVEVSAGSQLIVETVQAADSSAMDTYLRLFDALGNEIARNDDGGAGYFSRIDQVFAEAGTFYFGVSGYGNQSYDPFDASSASSGSEGMYGLTIEHLSSNHGPTLGAIADIVTTRNSDAVTVPLDADDPDGDALTFTAEAEGVTVTFQNGNLIVQPEPGVAGEISVVVEVTDGFASAMQSFTVRVENQAPVLEQLADRSLSTQSGAELVVDLFAIDANGDEIAFEVTAVDVATGDPANVRLSLLGDQVTIEREDGYDGEFEVIVSASDGIDAAESRFRVLRNLDLMPRHERVQHVEGGLALVDLDDLIGVDLDRDVVAYDYRTDGNFTFNAFTGGFFGQMDLGNGLSLDSAQIEQLLAGQITVPRINAAEAVASAFQIRLVESNNYDEVRDALHDQLGGANVYFSSERFTNWASLENLAGSIGKVIASGGLLAEDVIGEAVEQFELEFQDLYSWLTAKAEQDLPGIGEALAESLLFQTDLEMPEFSLRWSPVDYRYDPQVSGTAAAVNGVIEQITGTVNEAALESRHLGFSVIWRNPQGQGLIQQRLESFGDNQLRGGDGFRDFLPSIDNLQSLSGGNELAQEVLSRFAEIQSGTGSLLNDFGTRVAQSLGLGDSLPASLVDVTNPVIDLKGSAVHQQVSDLLIQLAQGNEGSIEVETLELDVLTMALKVEFSVQHRHVWGTPEEIIEEVGNRIGQAVQDGIASVNEWLDEQLSAINDWESEQIDNIRNALPQWAQDRIDAFQDALAEGIEDAREAADREITNARDSIADALANLEDTFHRSVADAESALSEGIEAVREHVERELAGAIASVEDVIQSVQDEVAQGLESVNNWYHDQVQQLNEWASNGLADAEAGIQASIQEWEDWYSGASDAWWSWYHDQYATWENWLDGAIGGTYQDAANWLDEVWGNELDAAWDHYSDVFGQWGTWLDDTFDAAWQSYSDAWDQWDAWANGEYAGAWDYYNSKWAEWENWLSGAIENAYREAENWLRNAGNSAWQTISQVFGFGLVGTGWLDLPNWGSLPGWAQDWINGYINDFNSGVGALQQWYDGRVASITQSFNEGVDGWRDWYDDRTASLQRSYNTGIEDLGNWYDNRVDELQDQYGATIGRLDDLISGNVDWSSLPDWNLLPAWAQERINNAFNDFNEAIDGFDDQLTAGLDNIGSQFQNAVGPMRDQLASLPGQWQGYLQDALADADSEFQAAIDNWERYRDDRLGALESEILGIREHWQTQLDNGIAELRSIRDTAVAAAQQAIDDGRAAIENGVAAAIEGIERGFVEARDALTEQTQRAIDDFRDEALRQIGLDVDDIRDAAAAQREHVQRTADLQIASQQQVAELATQGASLRHAIAAHASGGFWLDSDGSRETSLDVLAESVHRSATAFLTSEALTGADPNTIDQVVRDLNVYGTAFQQHFASLSPEEQEAMREAYRANNSEGLQLTAEDALWGVGAVIFPGSILFHPEVSEVIGDRMEALLGNAFETVRQIIPGLVADVAESLHDFANGLAESGVLIRDGEVGEGFGRLLGSVGMLVRDFFGVQAVTIVNTVNNIVSGIIVGTLFGRELNAAERGFAHGIFGDEINLTSVQVVEAGFGSGMVAGRTIYMPELDLDDDFSRRRFAHELTHVYQDQQLPHNLGTQKATSELLSWMWGAGLESSPYVVELDDNTSWWDLGAEQQAQVVEDYQSHLDIVAGRSGSVDPTDGARADYERVLEQAGFFQWRN